MSESHVIITGIKLVPVYERGYQIGADETPQLYDIFVHGEWLGSRRTRDHCAETVRWHGAAP